MKKRILCIFILGIVFGSCSNNDITQPDPLELRLDSISNAKINAKENELARKNDSILQVLEVNKADSIEQEIRSYDSLKKIRTAPGKSIQKIDSVK